MAGVGLTILESDEMTTRDKILDLFQSETRLLQNDIVMNVFRSDAQNKRKIIADELALLVAEGKLKGGPPHGKSNPQGGYEYELVS